MSDTKISGLTGLSATDVVTSTDVLPIVDISATATKKITVDALMQSHLGVSKAWVNFNGVGTVSSRAAYNVSSITDHGAGDYSVGFTTPFASANYAVSIATSRTSTVNFTLVPIARIDAANAPTASSFRFQVGVPDVSRVFQAEDAEYISLAFYGDQ
jgi:hypothetical protein